MQFAATRRNELIDLRCGWPPDSEMVLPMGLCRASSFVGVVGDLCGVGVCPWRLVGWLASQRW
jgi:hypothetical protein